MFQIYSWIFIIIHRLEHNLKPLWIRLMVNMSKFICSFIIFDRGFLVAVATSLITTCKACSTASTCNYYIFLWETARDSWHFSADLSVPHTFFFFLIGCTCVFYSSGCVVSLIHIFVYKLFHYMQMSFPQQCWLYSFAHEWKQSKWLKQWITFKLKSVSGEEHAWTF